MTRARRSSVALLLTAVLALSLTAALTSVAVVVPATTASAHDQLIGNEPEDGATVEAPDSVELTFSGAIGDLGTQVAVTGPDGRSVVEGDPQVDGAVVEQDLVDDLPAGDYAVVWRVTSEDGHPISGDFSFSVEEDAGGAAAPATEEASTGTADGTADDTAETADDTADDADVTADPVEAQGEGGLPVWAWVVIALAALGLAGLLARTWTRGRE